ncbi:MAG: N-acetylmuramoyl-L-alanine amidase [Paracoccaceae bacterium]
MKITSHPSPNFGERRLGATPDLIVLHYTAMTSAKAAIARLCDPKKEVSAHYLVSPTGNVIQLVDDAQRAWHAGAGSWGGCSEINSRSIGIELANDGYSAFPVAQMNFLEKLLGAVMDRWNIPPERVIGHSDMAPGRKSDPGTQFDWQRLALRGLSVWPHSEDIAPPGDGRADEFLHFAAAFGYAPNAAPAALLSAFRQRFRPRAEGALEPVDVVLIRDLAARFPVDRTAPST